MNRISTQILAIILLIAPLEAVACGSVTQQFFGMGHETDKERLVEFLRSHDCSSELGFSPEAEPYVALVLMNAARAGVSKDLFERVFARFNCVARLRHQPAYQVLVDYIGEARVTEICSPETLERVYVVSARGGANLRASPSLDGEKIGTVAEGVVAIDGEPDGEWIRVETYAGTGYMHESTLRPYLPGGYISIRTQEDDLAAVLSIGHDTSVRGEEISLSAALLRTRYREVRPNIEVDEIIAVITGRPDLIIQWVRYSEDKRSSGGWYMHAENLEIGKLADDASTTSYGTIEETVAHYILRELDYWATLEASP